MEAIITQLQELGVPTVGIRAALVKQGFSAEEIEKALPKAGRKCFLNEYLDWLAEEKRSMEEAEAYIIHPDNSDNVRNYAKTHLKTAALALKIWEAKD